jgi:hypothetical protein
MLAQPDGNWTRRHRFCTPTVHLESERSVRQAETCPQAARGVETQMRDQMFPQLCRDRYRQRTGDTVTMYSRAR